MQCQKVVTTEGHCDIAAADDCIKRSTVAQSEQITTVSQCEHRITNPDSDIVATHLLCRRQCYSMDPKYRKRNLQCSLYSTLEESSSCRSYVSAMPVGKCFNGTSLQPM
jgi:hypothetical protein